MNGDLSRVTFNPFKHFTSIVLQQGRVQLDADANEQTAILLHHLRSMAADLIGQHGGPDDLFTNQQKRTGLLQRNCGFAIIGASKNGNTNFFPDAQLLQSEQDKLTKTPQNRVPLLISGGHYYVDGLLCENEDSAFYFEQPYLKRANDEEIKKLTGDFLVYLDVWERHVTAMEEPSIREVALGGADTAARTQLIWQVRIADESIPAPANTCVDFNPTWPQALQILKPANRGRLRAMAKDNETNGDKDEDVCITSPEARFRGLENQLYRVEIHRSGPAMDSAGSNPESAATIKWSRNNGTTTAALKEPLNGDRLTVSGLRDLSRWFEAGNWIEITHDALELSRLPGTLVRLAKVEGEVLTIDPYTTSGTIYKPNDEFNDLPIRNLKVRRWDQKEAEDDLLQDGAIPIQEDVWIDLEDGVRIKFEPSPAANPAHYTTGDYWLIPARVATGDVEWPPQPTGANPEPQAVAPQGIEHHYAPLAAVKLAAGKVTGVVDLRHKFGPLAACTPPPV
jgi:hypothetical protein